MWRMGTSKSYSDYVYETDFANTYKKEEWQPASTNAKWPTTAIFVNYVGTLRQAQGEKNLQWKKRV